MDDESERHELETVKEQVAEETYGWVGPTTKCVNSHSLKFYSPEYDQLYDAELQEKRAKIKRKKPTKKREGGEASGELSESEQGLVTSPSLIPGRGSKHDCHHCNAVDIVLEAKVDPESLSRHFSQVLSSSMHC